MITKCEKCGAEIRYINTPIGVVACDAEETLYWNDEAEVLLMTPNGEQFWGSVNRCKEHADGWGYKVHFCPVKDKQEG